jgi:hypothetical protein
MGEMADYLLEQADADVDGVLEAPRKTIGSKRHIHQQTKVKITCCFCGSKCVRIRGDSEWVKCSNCGELHRK